MFLMQNLNTRRKKSFSCFPMVALQTLYYLYKKDKVLLDAA